MQFPLEMPPGKRIPFWSQIPSRSFRLRADPETHPILKPKSGTHFPPKVAKGKHIPFPASNQDALSAGIPPTAKTTKEGAPFQPFEDRLYPREALSRSHISANEISLPSPLLAAAS